MDLRLNSHIDHLLSLTAGPVYLCQKLAYQHRLPSLAIRRFYIAFVRPRLEYCNAAWCSLTRIQALRLEKVQVRVARAIVRCPGGSRSQVLQDAGLPTLSWRRREHCLGLLWSLVNWMMLSSSVISCSSVSSFQCSLRKAFADDKFT